MSHLPADVAEIVEYLGDWSAGYDSGLQWRERDKLKADMMNVRHRWLGVDRDAFRRECLKVGLTSSEAAELVDFLKRTQEGKRLRCSTATYRDFRFQIEPEPRGVPLKPTTSRDWFVSDDEPLDTDPQG